MTFINNKANPYRAQKHLQNACFINIFVNFHPLRYVNIYILKNKNVVQKFLQSNTPRFVIIFVRTKCHSRLDTKIDILQNILQNISQNTTNI